MLNIETCGSVNVSFNISQSVFVNKCLFLNKIKKNKIDDIKMHKIQRGILFLSVLYISLFLNVQKL